ncbi:MocR-like pyridoxine biosynthesis transcription factor PdxR [Novispirillum itersonii]|uniref:GntR family transcriptional regulator/MocR family aminotransferase n=1 Tax=Novispirillum itersonii TaxID=189 RepID=A0A7X0DLN4_NOVIT|nr:PLP-dependent aminotransferase family protein [Novispirillum itersonii]MBB6210151.1 GntR family transcriptional regulator/MocR family aminotransferase [Novispirillum itersonii]
MAGAWVGVSLDPQGNRPVYVQLYGQLRDLILRRALRPQERLPSSRLVATELGVSRATVIAAYDQLVGEGYIAGRPGSGMYVCPLPEDTLMVTGGHPARRPAGPVNSAPPLKTVAADWQETPGWAPPLQPGEPDGRLFPSADWVRALSNSWRRPSPRVLGHGETVFGDPALRQALARHLQVWRGIDVTPDQIIVTAGAGEGIDLTLRAFVEAGAGVVLENPGYSPARNMVADRGGQVIHCPVDGSGLCLDSLAARQAAGDCAPRLIMVTPSRQFPLGLTMPLSRRLSLIDWGRHNNCMILEDDYDSEFRYGGRPLAALASLDHGGRVLYLGSFSKVFASGVRLGYLAVPETAIDRYRACLEATGPRASLALQPALAEFMDSGAYARHLRRMRRVYAERQECLLTALAEQCSDWLAIPEIQPSGMHVLARLTARVVSAGWSDQDLATRCEAAGVMVRALSSYCQPPVQEQGLLIGFAAYTPQEIRSSVVKLRMTLSLLS